MGQQQEEIGEQVTLEPKAPVTVPGGLGTARAWFLFGQTLAAVGAVISFLGLGESTWVNRTYQFLRSNEAVPAVGLGLWIVGGIVLWWRTKGRAETLAFLAAMLPNRISQVQGELRPSVQMAVEHAQATGPVTSDPSPSEQLVDEATTEGKK